MITARNQRRILFRALVRKEAYDPLSLTLEESIFLRETRERKEWKPPQIEQPTEQDFESIYLHLAQTTSNELTDIRECGRLLKEKLGAQTVKAVTRAFAKLHLTAKEAIPLLRKLPARKK
jgi:hypothetical protein